MHCKLLERRHFGFQGQIQVRQVQSVLQSKDKDRVKQASQHPGLPSEEILLPLHEEDQGKVEVQLLHGHG